MIRSRNIRLAATVIGVSVAAALPPVAFASEETVQSSSDQPVYINPSTGYPSSLPAQDKPNINQPAGSASNPQPVADQPSSTSGFDWPSAAIGAAAGTALLLMLLSATIGVGRRSRGPLRSGAQLS